MVFLSMMSVSHTRRCVHVVGRAMNMTVLCLVQGRGISLPAGGVAQAKMALLGVGGYARVRKQFKVPYTIYEHIPPLIYVYAYIHTYIRRLLGVGGYTRVRKQFKVPSRTSHAPPTSGRLHAPPSPATTVCAARLS